VASGGGFAFGPFTLDLSSEHGSNRPTRFSAVGLHWLNGLLCLARGADVEALASFERELALEASGHLYARECGANTSYAIGACHLRRGETSAARAAFEQAMARVPAHPMVRAGLVIGSAGLKTGGSISQETGGSVESGAADLQVGPPSSVDHAFARAAWLVARGDAPTAAAIVDAALASAPPGNAGWTLPVEPLLDAMRHREIWEPTLTRVRMRAE